MLLRVHETVAVALPPISLDWALNFVHRGPQLALAYWRSRCKSRNRPARADISPSEMSEFLPYVALIDVHKPAGSNASYYMRLAGTHVEQVFGPITGHHIGSILPPEIEERWRTYFDTVRGADKPLRLSGRVAFANKTWLMSEALLAPLGEEQGPVAMIFAAYAAWPDQQSNA